MYTPMCAGTIVNVSKAAGDSVAEDEVIAQIETDKVTIDVRAPHAGTISNIMVRSQSVSSCWLCQRLVYACLNPHAHQSAVVCMAVSSHGFFSKQFLYSLARQLQDASRQAAGSQCCSRVCR